MSIDAAHEPNDGMPPLDPGPACMSRFEFMHPVLFYAPVMLYAAGLMIKHRSVTLPALANPAIFAGGAVGERKSDVFALAGPYAQQFIAKNCAIDLQETSGPLLDMCLEAMRQANVQFPIVAKPDTGLRGAGVRPVEDIEQLKTYLAQFPTDQTVMLQEKADYPGEAGVFYIRYPNETRGRIFSLTLKYTATVKGDGKRTLEELIDECPRCKRMEVVYKTRHQRQLKTVIPIGETFPLNFAGNHARGAIFRNGHGHITEPMLDAFDRIAKDIKDLHFTRFDVRFKSLDDLKAGRDFKIVEVNGVGAEATHIWDCQMELLEAYRTLAAQWRHAFSIGAANRRREHRLPPVMKIFKIWLSELMRADNYPLAS